MSASVDLVQYAEGFAAGEAQRASDRRAGVRRRAPMLRLTWRDLGYWEGYLPRTKAWAEVDARLPFVEDLEAVEA